MTEPISHTLPDCGAVRARIRAAGLRATRTRISIFAELVRLGGHLSVADLTESLRTRSSSVSRMSVYNVLADLEQAGLVMRADTGPGAVLYEASETWHHHFVCRRCREVYDVPCVIGHKPCLEPEFMGGVVDEAQVIFRGVCNGCLDGKA